jgi:geranylgeranyl pyrophosphate synthase
MALGTAYQVYDDCLDLFGTEEEAGKTLGSDLAKGKVTLPLLLLMERSQGSELQELRACLADWEAAGSTPAATTAGSIPDLRRIGQGREGSPGRISARPDRASRFCEQG